MSEAVLYEVHDNAGWITLNRPESHNSLSDELVAGLNDSLRRALEDDEVRTVVLTGNGRSFCAGADLKAGGGKAIESGEDDYPPFVSSMMQLWDSPKPVIGRVQGNAFGGGLGLMAACDMVVAAEHAKFAFTEVRLGVIPAIISVFVLRKMSLADATPLFLTGQRFEAPRAQELGLVHTAVPAEELDYEVHQIVEQTRECGPLALGEAKKLLRTIPNLSVEEGLQYAQQTITRLFASEEAAEGMAAFREKRKPRWAPHKSQHS